MLEFLNSQNASLSRAALTATYKNYYVVGRIQARKYKVPNREFLKKSSHGSLRQIRMVVWKNWIGFLNATM